MKWTPLLHDHAAALACSAIVVIVGIAYSNALDGPFIFDDKPSIKENASLSRWEQVWPVFWDVPEEGATVQGRPVLNASFALNYAVGGLDVREYHVTNVAIHSIAALALFALVRFTLRLPTAPAPLGSNATAIAFAVAIVWAAHPIQTESVTYLVQRAESLAGVWYFLTLYSFARGFSAVRPRPWFAAAVVCCTLGMGTKEVVVSAPLAVLLYDRAFLAGSFGAALRARRPVYLALAATWVLLALLVIGSEGRSGTAGFGSGVSVIEYARSQSVFILRYLRLTFWPDQLVFDYGVELVADPRAYVPAGIAVVALFAAALWAVVRWPQVGLLAFLFFALLAPTSSVVPVATQTAAEHRMYLPLAPLVVLAVTGSALVADRLARERGLRLTVCAWFAVGVLLAVVSHARNDDYRTERSIWEDVAAKWPGNARCHSVLGELAVSAGEPAVAEDEFRTAVRLLPNWRHWYNLASFLARQGRVEEARRAFEEVVSSDRNGLGYFERSRFHLRLGERDAALRDVEEGLTRASNRYQLAPGYHQRGMVYLSFGRASDALADFTRAIENNPILSGSYYERGRVRSAGGDQLGAIADFSEAIRLNSEDSDCYAARAETYFVTGKPDRAVADASEAIRINPRSIFFVLRSGYLHRLGRIDDAVADLNRAIDTDPNYKDAYLARALCRMRTRPDLARADLLRYQQTGGQLNDQLRAFLAAGK